MKKIPFLLWAIVLLLIGLQSCLRTIEIPVLGEASGAIIRIGNTVRSGQTQTFTLDVHLVDASGNYVSNLSRNNFAIKDTNTNPSGMSFSLIDVKGGNRTQLKGDYSAMLLLDQSGSINGCNDPRYGGTCGAATDPDNLRIEASKIFADAIGSGDNIALSSFSGDKMNYPNSSRVHYNFTRRIELLKNTLDSLADKPYGGTPLYSATFNMINFTAQNGPTANKVIILLTDGQSIEDGRTRQEVETLSKQRSVPVYTVGLSRNVSFSELSDMAINTGGSFMWARDAKQLISYFGTLGNLLRGNADYYTLTFQATANSFPSSARTLFLEVTLPNGKKFLMPYSIRFV
jgi:von Willebrand factor type A domain